MTEAFEKPAAPGGGGIDLNDVKGALLLFNVVGFEPDVQTVHGVSDAVRCDVDVLDGSSKGESYPDALIFPRVLVRQLKRSMGKKVVGRLGQGAKQPGKNAPWQLEEPNESDLATASAYLVGAVSGASSDAPPF